MSNIKRYLIDLLGEDADITEPEMAKEIVNAIEVLEKEQEDGDNES